MISVAADLRWGLDPVSFAIEGLNWPPGSKLDPWQEHALRWQGKRLMLNCHRQSGKSTVAAILALHRALYRSQSLTLVISPSLRQSSELFRKVGDFLDQLEVPPALLEDNKLSCTLNNRSRIVSLPSKEQTVRGFSGVNLIIEDEAARVPDDLYRSIRPMLAVSGGDLILMSTPWGKRGHFFEEWTHGPEWERIEVKATECPRITPEFLEQESRGLGAWWYRQEYLCSFEDTVDAVFQYETIHAALSDDVKPLF